MDEIRVERILQEHEGWEAFLNHEWREVTAVGRDVVVARIRTNSEYIYSNCKTEIRRPPQPAPKLPSVRLCPLYEDIQIGKGPYQRDLEINRILDEHYIKIEELCTAIQQLKEKREGK